VSGDELDRAIDDAVHEIMGAEPPAGLRQRVIGRLAEPERRVWLTAPRLAVAAAMAICLAAGALVMLTTNRTRTPEHVDVASAPQLSQRPPFAPVAPSATGTPVPSIASRPDPQSTPVVSRRSAGGQAERMVAATSLIEAENPVAISPLDPLRKIEPEPVKSEIVQMDAIAIAPLQEIEPVTIEPLSSTPR
jgi:hypothetical protein